MIELAVLITRGSRSLKDSPYADALHSDMGRHGRWSLKTGIVRCGLRCGMLYMSNSRFSSSRRRLIQHEAHQYMAGNKQRLIIDTDTASDDAVALMMALRAPHVDVVAITTVAGNVSVAQATRNALTVVERCGAEVPVYRGLARPLLRAASDATFFHGKDGMGDLNLPAPRRAAEGEHAVD
ncbi:MAG TPA: nucleoside hydrolase, partial [Herpetosiphonaceae bacterium]